MLYKYTINDYLRYGVLKFISFCFINNVENGEDFVKLYVEEMRQELEHIENKFPSLLAILPVAKVFQKIRRSDIVCEYYSTDTSSYFFLQKAVRKAC